MIEFKIIADHEKTKNDLLGNFNMQNHLKMIMIRK